MKVKELNFGLDKLYGGFQFFPYQFAIGISIRYANCDNLGLLRFYLGPFKLWVNYK